MVGAAAVFSVAATMPLVVAVAAGVAAVALPLVLRQPASDAVTLGTRAAREQRAPTVEDVLRADFEADKIDALDFALAVDAAADLDAPARPTRRRVETRYGSKLVDYPRPKRRPVSANAPGARWHPPTRRWLDSSDAPGGYRPLPPALEMADLTRRIHRQRAALTDLQRRIADDIVTAKEARAMIELCENGHTAGKKP